MSRQERAMIQLLGIIAVCLTAQIPVDDVEDTLAAIDAILVDVEAD